MKNHILFLLCLLSIFTGCNKEEPLPELGIEGVYMMNRVGDVHVSGEDNLPFDNVYWFFADRTFQKASLTDGVLVEASGTFSPVPHPGGDVGEGEAYELIFLVGAELINGCLVDREILVQTTATELLHEGESCGEPDIYYVKADFGGQ